MTWLALTPKWLLLVIAVALGAAAGVQTARLAATKHVLADLRESVLKAKEARQEQAEAQREIERQRTRAISKGVDDAFTQVEQARRDRDRAARLAADLERLRQQPGVHTGGDRADPPVTQGSAAASGAGLVFTDVFGGFGERLRSCAAALDESLIAGRLCERAYDAVARTP